MHMGSLGPTEIILIILVIVLLFGAKKLPELARGSGRALRIFKAETKSLDEDDVKDDVKTPEQLELEARRAADRDAAAGRPVAEPVERRDDTTA
jgi:sec-independent protein translocase protein TatA